jgi:hypothetical protein
MTLEIRREASSADTASPGRAAIATTVAILSALSFFAVFHVWWPLVFPTPWSDESHFLVPALNLATTGSPTAEQMLNGQGIYWVPSGMYLIDGFVFAATGADGIRLARAMSFVEIALAAFFIRQIAASRLAGLPDASTKATLLALAWFASMPVMLAANIARPEAPMLLMSAASVLCLINGFMLGGAGLALLAFLTHPLLAIPAVGVVCYAAIFGAERRKPRPWELVSAGLGFALLAYEASRLILNQEAYFEHWALQLERKAGREIAGETLAGIGLLMATAVHVAAMKLWKGRRTGLADDATSILLLFGLACVAVHFYGQEMWYWPLAITGCLLAFLAVLPAIGRIGPLASHTGVFAAAVAIALLTWSLALRERGFMHFTARPWEMQSISSDRAAVVAKVDSYLEAAGAERTLVTPYFFEELRGRAEPGFLHAESFQPLRRPGFRQPCQGRPEFSAPPQRGWTSPRNPGRADLPERREVRRAER